MPWFTVIQGLGPVTNTDFSLGRFAEIESITTLGLMVMHYEISVTEDPRFVHETWEQRRDRVMGACMGSITLNPKGVPLTFKRRIQ